MAAVASQITTLTIVYSTIYSDADQSSASLAFVRGIHRYKWPVPRKMFPFDDVIMVIHFPKPSEKHYDEHEFSDWTGKWLILSHDVSTGRVWTNFINYSLYKMADIL